MAFVEHFCTNSEFLRKIRVVVLYKKPRTNKLKLVELFVNLLERTSSSLRCPII